MPQEMLEITLARNKPAADIETFIGRAHPARYRFSLLGGKDGSRIVGEGVNVDDIEDKYRLGKTVGELDKLILMWEIDIRAVEVGPGQRYYAVVWITQGSGSVPGGTFEYSGELKDGFQPIFTYARLRVA